MVIPHDERTFILELADQGRTPEDIAALLVQRRALVEVQGVLQDHTGRIVAQEIIQSKLHFVFYPPRREGEDPRAVRVYLHDLAAFCSQHKLNIADMERVAMGEIDEHRGWRQGPISALYCPMVSRALILHRADVAATHTYAPATTHKVSYMPVNPLPSTTYKP